MIVVTFEPSADRHWTGARHPERPERLVAAHRALEELDARQVLAARPAEPAELLAVHDDRYLDLVESVCHAGGGDLDPDTPVAPGSWDTALLSAGAGMVGAAALLDGQDRSAFVLTRPPGHHAGRARAAGFCLLNNLAVTAAFLVERGERVAIFDWDVHHGDGTQEIFWDDPRVLFVSVHQWPLYPGTGRPSERGGPSARGLTINVPLPPQTAGDAYLAAFDEIAAPAFAGFQPTWILVSAGFDAHRRDPLAGMALSAGDFGLLTERVMAAAGSAGRIMLFLEGGYDLDALRDCVVTCGSCLAGEARLVESPTSGGIGREVVAEWSRRLAEIDPEA